MAGQQDLNYTADGLPMRGRLYLPDDDDHLSAAVLVFSEAPGPGPFVHGQAARLASLGYAALVCDLHGEAAIVADMAEMTGLIMALRGEPSHMRARAQGALTAIVDTLQLPSRRVAAIGYCFGGAMALELGRSGADIAGIVGFHSTLSTNSAPADNALQCPVLVCIGADDPMIETEERRIFEEEMRSYGVDWQLHIHGGARHGFTNPDAEKIGRPDVIRYHPAAATRSWTAMQGFFDEIFK